MFRGDVRNFSCHWILTGEDKVGFGGGGEVLRLIHVRGHVYTSTMSMVDRLCGGGTSASKRMWNRPALL